MRLRTILVYSIATTAVAIISPKATPIVDMPSVAQAETNVSISIGTFYNDLAPHGSWVNYQDSYVFVPARVSAGWRPYTVGHWVHTKRYGWLWVSDEPFGWATYHYGRWGYAEDIGWYWVPGKRWAPAWVTWKRSKDYVIWAPLPPDGDDVSVEVRIEDVPDVYWVAVPSRSFLDVDLSVVIIDDDNERVRVVEAAEPVGHVTIENNVIINNVIDIDYVEQVTEKKVETVEVKETEDPKQAGKESEGQIAAFTGEVKEEKDAKPAEVKDVEEVKKEKAEAPQGQQPGSEQPTGTQGEGQTGQSATSPEDGDQTGKKKKTTGDPAQTQDGQPAQAETERQKGTAPGESDQAEEAQPEQGQDQPMKKKSKASEQTKEPDATQAEQGQDQPVKKKKSKASEQTKEPDATQAEQGQDQPVKKMKSQAVEESGQPEQGQGQPVKKKQKGTSEEPAQGEQPEAGCDPATGQNC